MVLCFFLLVFIMKKKNILHIPQTSINLNYFDPTVNYRKNLNSLKYCTVEPHYNKHLGSWVVLSSRTDFSVDMSGQISSRPRHLSTKQWSGNKCGDVPTKIQTSIYAMDHRDWPGKQRLAEHQACRCTHLQRFSQAVKPFWRLILSIFCFLNE